MARFARTLKEMRHDLLLHSQNAKFRPFANSHNLFNSVVVIRYNYALYPLIEAWNLFIQWFVLQRFNLLF